MSGKSISLDGPRFSICLCSDSAAADGPVEISYAEFRRLGQTAVLGRFVKDIRNIFDVALLADGRSIHCVLLGRRKSPKRQQSSGKLEKMADIHGDACARVESLRQAAKRLEENHTSATPKPLNQISSVGTHTRKILDALSRSGNRGIYVEYRNQDFVALLPILPREVFSDLMRPESTHRAVNGVILGVLRDWRTSSISVTLDDGSKLCMPMEFSVDLACQSIAHMTLLHGSATLFEGSWHVVDGWALEVQEVINTV